MFVPSQGGTRNRLRTLVSYPSNVLNLSTYLWTILYNQVKAENTILKPLNSLTVAIFKPIPSFSVIIAPAASERLRAISEYLGGVL